MKNYSYFLLAASFTIFTSCGPDKKSNVTTTLPTAPLNSAQTNQAPVNAPANNNNAVQITSPQNQSGTPATAVALNPAHGLPNHRCDIAVGAPLNSSPQTNGPIVPKLPAPSLTLPAQGSVAAGTNPAHGLPGHNCSIPVGAPLKRL